MTSISIVIPSINISKLFLYLSNMSCGDGGGCAFITILNSRTILLTCSL